VCKQRWFNAGKRPNPQSNGGDSVAAVFRGNPADRFE
jgi:hypothetical protein